MAEPNFIIVKSPDPITILIEKFPEMEELQEDKEYGSYYVYNRFGECLASLPDDEQLWQRAYELFETQAKDGSALTDLLLEASRVSARIALSRKSSKSTSVQPLESPSSTPWAREV